MATSGRILLATAGAGTSAIAAELARRGRDVHVFTPTAPAPATPREHVDAPAVTAELAAALDARRPDVLHVLDLARLGAGVLDVAAARGVRTLVDAHDLWLLCARGTLVRGDGERCDGPTADGAACAACLGSRDLASYAFRRAELLARLAARVDRCLVPTPERAATLADAGLPAELLAVVPPAAGARGVEALVDDLERVYAGEPAAPADPADVVLRWTGDHETATSLAVINRAVTARLEGRPGLVMQRQSQERDVRKPATERPPTVEVRHQWPPAFDAPPGGRLVLIQPWEFGSIPIAWQAPMRDAIDELWVPSEYVRRMYLDGGVDPARVHVVANGADLDVFRPDGPRFDLDAPAGTRFLFVGGTINRKGVDVLMQAYATAFSGRGDVTLVVKDVAPTGAYKGRNVGTHLRDFADDPELPRLVYLDVDLDTAELAALYRSCDVLVHPYRGEGFAMPVLEAMACGLPVVVTAGGPTDEFVPDDACWRIASTRSYPPARLVADWPTIEPIWMLEPDVDHLARILREVDGDAAERARRAAAARRAAQAYGWDAIADAYAARIAAVAARPPRAVSARAEPLELPDARGLNLLATPAWAGADRLAELLAAYASAYGPHDDVALYLLADPDLDGDAERWEAHVLAAVDAVGIDLEALADLSVLDHAGAADLARVHAAIDAYVPLHGGCGGHARLARAAGAAVLDPTAEALRGLRPAVRRAA